MSSTFATLDLPSVRLIRNAILDERLNLLTRPQAYLEFLEQIRSTIEIERVQTEGRVEEMLGSGGKGEG